MERSAILTVQNHVITRNPRISVSHDQHHTWSLHISSIQESDRGGYMYVLLSIANFIFFVALSLSNPFLSWFLTTTYRCQINTAAAKTRVGYITVVGECQNESVLVIHSFIFKAKLFDNSRHTLDDTTSVSTSSLSRSHCLLSMLERDVIVSIHLLFFLIEEY